MSIAEEINNVIRKITTSGETHRVILERVFDTEAADLWNACTSDERLSRWFEPVRGDLALGGRYTLTKSGTEGDILRCEPPRHLTITWEYQRHISHVDVDLIPANNRTVLRLIHRCPPDDHWETYGPAATGVGWEESLRALSLYLAGDPRCEPDEMARLTSTLEGQELTRRAADAWGRVDQEAGTPASTAQARALRTAAFYRRTNERDENDG
ncbi:MAG: SRPBCC family protein [Ornithinimicrobium sp.]